MSGAHPLVSMRAALSDENLLGKALPGESWAAWRVLLIAMMGEALTDEEGVIFTRLTGREREPLERVETFLGVIGRRGGKTRAAATLAVYLGTMVDYSGVLAVGERPVVLMLAQNQVQARITLGYALGLLNSIPMLTDLVASEAAETVMLKSGVALEVRSASFRGLRGVTCLACICDEAAFWYDESGGSMNPDVEIMNAVRPGLATTGGPLIIISSPTVGAAKSSKPGSGIMARLAIPASSLLVAQAAI